MPMTGINKYYDSIADLVPPTIQTKIDNVGPPKSPSQMALPKSTDNRGLDALDIYYESIDDLIPNQVKTDLNQIQFKAPKAQTGLDQCYGAIQDLVPTDIQAKLNSIHL